MADASKPQQPQVDTQQQQQHPSQDPSQQPLQGPSQQPSKDPSQQPLQGPSQQPPQDPSQHPLKDPQQQPQPQQPQQPLQPAQQPLQPTQQQQQQQQLTALQIPYQQQAPSSPQQPGYAPQSPLQPEAQMPPSPQAGFYQLPPQGYPPLQQGYQYPPQQFPPQGYAYPPQPWYPPQQQPGYPQQYPPPQHGYPQPGYPPQPQPGYPQQYPPAQSQMYSNNPWAQQNNQYVASLTYPVSNGYTPGEFAQNYSPKADADVIRKAFTPGSLDEKALIHIIPSLSPQQLESIRHCLYADTKIKISSLLDKGALSSDFYDPLRAVILGPLEFDVWLVNRALSGAIYKPNFVDMVLLGRKNGDIEAIKAMYHKVYNKHLVELIKSTMKGEIESLFRNAIEARRQDESTPIVDSVIADDVKEMYAAMVGKSEGNRVSEILVTRSDAQIRKITEVYETTFKGKTLEEVFKKKFKGHMEDALLYILQGANNKVLRDARLLEKTMKGLGTRTEELSYRLAILHWDEQHLKDVKVAYKKEFPKRVDLVTRVKGETSGNHQKLLIALLG